MANKRQRKKAEKNRQIQRIRQSGVKKKKLTQKEIKHYSDIIAQQEKKEKAKKDRLELQTRKIKELVKHNKGLDISTIKTSVLKYIKLTDIQQGKVTKESHPDLFKDLTLDRKQTTFNFNKKYKMPNGQALYFAFWDYSGENDFEVLLSHYQRKNSKTLLKLLKHLVNKPETYSKDLKRKSKGKEGNSSGKAGDVQFTYGSKEVIRRFDRTVTNEDFEWVFAPKRRQHATGNNLGWQKLANQYGDIYIEEFSAHNILAVITCIMDNITEDRRNPFYTQVYESLKVFPDLISILPTP